MSGIINDVDSLRAFRQRLDETAETLQKQLQKTEQAIEDVAKTWDDIKFLEFKKKFDEDKEKIEPLSKKIKEFEDSALRPLEEMLREYLSM
jgi:uncharacterized coiled-coil DUF342 family protein